MIGQLWVVQRRDRRETNAHRSVMSQ